MSEWKWIDGPPPEVDGDYVVTYGPYAKVAWRRDGAWKSGDSTRTERGWLVVNVEKHLRLPDLHKPLPLPRRFRAKFQGREVIGAKFTPTASGREFLTVGDDPSDWGWRGECELTDICYIDPEESA